MATKLERQKEFVGYRTTHDTCGICKHFSSKKDLTAWMKANNDYEISKGRHTIYSIASDGIEKNLMCSLHEFSVKKTAVCNNFEGK